MGNQKTVCPYMTSSVILPFLFMGFFKLLQIHFSNKDNFLFFPAVLLQFELLTWIQYRQIQSCFVQLISWLVSRKGKISYYITCHVNTDTSRKTLRTPHFNLNWPYCWNCCPRSAGPPGFGRPGPPAFWSETQQTCTTLADANTHTLSCTHTQSLSVW